MTSKRFELHATALPGLTLVERLPLGDQRGYLERMFCSQEFAMLTPGKVIEQVNHTMTLRSGTVRGMHYQLAPHSETKFVSCIRGRVFDVAVDLRSGSPTFLHWCAVALSEDNHRTLVIPDGFAHGFQTLSDGCEMLYLHTARYEPTAERALNAVDPKIGIEWPMPITERSARDESHPTIADGFSGIVI